MGGRLPPRLLRLWSRGHKARGQGHKINPRPKGNALLKDTGASVLKKKVFQEKFSGDLKKKKTKRKVFKKIFHVISERGKQKKSSRIFCEVSGVFQLHFNRSKKNSAVLEPRTEKFSRTWGFEAKALTFEAKAKDFKMCSWVFPLNDFTSIMSPSPLVFEIPVNQRKL